VRSEAKLIGHELRNTRDVLAIRLSGPEREQIARAATRQKLTLSGFVRSAALQTSARVLEKVSPAKPPAPKPAEARETPLVLIDEEPRRGRLVEGLLLMPDGRVLDPPGE
jgi:Protein of unknown function (DUF1778)